jgi:hypothetical protein
MATSVVKFFALTFLLVVTGCGKEEPPQLSLERPMEWNDPLYPAVATVPGVIERSRRVLLVTRDAGDGGWQFMDGADTTGRKPVIILKDDVLKVDLALGKFLIFRSAGRRIGPLRRRNGNERSNRGMDP